MTRAFGLHGQAERVGAAPCYHGQTEIGPGRFHGARDECPRRWSETAADVIYVQW